MASCHSTDSRAGGVSPPTGPHRPGQGPEPGVVRPADPGPWLRGEDTAPAEIRKADGAAALEASGAGLSGEQENV